jgi:hypothetical protein
VCADAAAAAAGVAREACTAAGAGAAAAAAAPTPTYFASGAVAEARQRRGARRWAGSESALAPLRRRGLHVAWGMALPARQVADGISYFPELLPLHAKSRRYVTELRGSRIGNCSGESVRFRASLPPSPVVMCWARRDPGPGSGRMSGVRRPDRT